MADFRLCSSCHSQSGGLVPLHSARRYRGYEVWETKTLDVHGPAIRRQSDLPNEFLSLEQVLRANPRNLEACRLMANLAEAEHSKSALNWRKQVFELNYPAR